MPTPTSTNTIACIDHPVSIDRYSCRRRKAKAVIRPDDNNQEEDFFVAVIDRNNDSECRVLDAEGCDRWIV